VCGPTHFRFAQKLTSGPNEKLVATGQEETHAPQQIGVGQLVKWV
jgi:hypothetical protein